MSFGISLPLNNFGSAGFLPSSLNNLAGWWQAKSDVTSDAAAQFVIGDSTFLSRANASIGDLSPGDQDFSVAIWIFTESTTALAGLIGTYTVTGNQREWVLLIRDTGDIRFTISEDGTLGVGDFTSIDSASAPTEDAWHLVIATYTSSTGTMSLAIDDGTPVTDTVDDVFQGTANFVIGSFTAGVNPYDGRLDSAGFWTKVLSSAEQTFLYDSGNGKTYAGIGVSGTDGADLKTSLVAWWDLNEWSDGSGAVTRIDAHTNSHDLTDNATVTIADGIPASAANDGEAVGSWADQSGNGKDAVQATGASKPEFKTTYINFDGTDDELTAGSVASTLSTIFIVLEAANGWDHTTGDDAGVIFDGATGDHLITLGPSTANLTNEVISVSSGGAHASGYTASGAGATIAAGTHIIAYRFDTSTPEWQIYLNGGSNLTDESNDTPAAITATDVTIGANNAADSFYPSGIREVVVYSDVLTDAEVNQVGEYLSSQHSKAWTAIS